MSQQPSKIGKYEILRELGRGAMGIVYEAFDPTIERTVALKTIRRDQLEGAESADLIARFQREAKAAGRLNHPNIVSIYDFGDDHNTLFIAMEFVHGRELKSYFEKDERFPIGDVVRIMSQLLDALEYSHSFGVVHRDIKPANIIIQPGGQVKVADFGIARIESSQYTQAGTGTRHTGLYVARAIHGSDCRSALRHLFSRCRAVSVSDRRAPVFGCRDDDHA